MNQARSSTKLFVSSVSLTGVRFIGVVIFARELGASQLGIFFLFQALLGLSAIPTDLGLRGAVEKRISEGDAPGEFLSSALLLKLIPISVTVLLIILTRPYINAYLGAEFALYLVLAVILQEAAQLSLSVLKGELRVGETAILKLARGVVWVGLGFVLVSFDYGVDALVYSLLTGLAVMAAWGWYRTSTTFGRPSVPRARSLFDYGKFNAISSIGGYFYNWMDVAIIGLFLTSAHVAAYEIAWRVAGISILFSQSIGTSIFPQISDWSSDDESDKIEALIPTAMIPSLFLVVPAFFGILLYSEEILSLVFGPEYAIAGFVLVLLMSDKIAQAIQIVVGRSLQAIDKPNLAAVATIISLVLNGVLNVVFVLYFGLVGAAIATVTASLTNDFLHVRYLRKYVDISFPFREVSEIVIASLVMTGALVSINSVIKVTNLIELIGVIGAGIVVYGACSLLLPNLRKQIFIWAHQLGVPIS